MPVFNIGEHVLYRQSAPNLAAIRSLCLWSNNAAELYQQEYALGKYSCLAEIVQIHSADEDEGEPEIFVLKPLSNLETFNTGNEYAFRCEIEKTEEYA